MKAEIKAASDAALKTLADRDLDPEQAANAAALKALADRVSGQPAHRVPPALRKALAAAAAAAGVVYADPKQNKLDAAAHAQAARAAASL